MTGLISAAALAIVVTAALYLLALGGTALVRPESARQFIGAHATTRTLHFTELGLRILAGAALIITAPHAAFTPAFLLFGWILVASSVVLAIVPWRLHQRFAAWSVPQAMHYLPLIGVASIAGGLGLIAAVALPRAAGCRSLMSDGRVNKAGEQPHPVVPFRYGVAVHLHLLESVRGTIPRHAQTKSLPPMSPRSLDPEFLATLPPLERRALEAVTAFLWGNGDVATAAQALTELAGEEPVGEALEMDEDSVVGLDVASMPGDMQERYRELLRVLEQS